MKNIQVIDGAANCVYDIFSATDEEFALIFPAGTDVAFIDDVYERGDAHRLDVAFTNIGAAESEKQTPREFRECSFMSFRKRRFTIRLGVTKML